MLRRSFSVLCLLTALGLAMILIHAFLDQGGTAKALETAREQVKSGRAADAVRVLNRLQRQLGTSGETKQRLQLHLLRSKAHAHPSLRNYDKALDDIEVLLTEFTPSDFRNAGFADRLLEVKRDKVLYLTRLDREQQAAKVARRLIDKNPRDQQLLDLAGQNLQRLYQKKLRELNDKTLPESLTPKHRRELLEIVLPYVYRMDDGKKNNLRRKEIIAFLADKEIDPKTIEQRLQEFDAIHGLIRDAAQVYRRALREKGLVAASLRGYSGILIRAGRANEAIILSWLYMRRSVGFVQALSAGQAMEACLSLDNPRLAVFIGRQWLTSVERQKTRHRGDSTWVHAYVQFARAAFELRDVTASSELRAKIEKLPKNGNFAFWYSLIAGLEAVLRKDVKNAEAQLGKFCHDRRNFVAPIEGKDLLSQAMRVRLQLARRNNDFRWEARILRDWTRLRPSAIEPLKSLARVRIEKMKQPYLAATDAKALYKLEDRDGSKDEALELLRQARELGTAADGKDAKTLFAKMLAENRILPANLPYDIQHLSIALLAKEAGRPDILLPNLRRYLLAYPFSSKGRYLLAKLQLEAGESQKALFETEAILDRRPDHLAARLLRHDILLERKAAPKLVRQEALELLKRHPASPRIARMFGDLLLARKEFAAALLLSEQSRAADACGHFLPWIRGRALIGLQRFVEAVASLKSVPPEQEEYAQALGLALRTAAAHGMTQGTDALVRSLLDSRPASSILMKTARGLARHGRFAAANSLLVPILAESSRIDSRTAEFHLLRGKILLALGKEGEAANVLEGAFSYGSSQAGPLLALLAIFDNDESLAKEWLAMLPRLEGQPLVMAYLQYCLKNKTKALAQLDRAEIDSPALAAILRYTLAVALAANTKKDLPRPTGNMRLDRILTENAGLVFEALCLAPAFEFHARAQEALDALLALDAPKDSPGNFGSFIETFMHKTRIQFLRAMCLELSGQKQKAAGHFLATLGDYSMLLTSMPEVFRLLPKDAELLATPDFPARYLQLMATGIPHPFLRQAASKFAKAAAKFALSIGNLSAFRSWISFAGQLTPEDKDLAMLLAKSLWDGGEHVKALRKMTDLLKDVEAKDEVRLVDQVMGYALKALDLPLAHVSGSELSFALLPLFERARQYHNRARRHECQPLGKASLLYVESLETDPDLRQSPDILAKRRTAVLSDYLQGFLGTDLAPNLDEEGLVAVLNWLLDRGEIELIDSSLERLLLRDPSLEELWLFRARLYETRGRPDLAERLLTWICEYLKSEELLASLARLRGGFGLGTLRENEILLRAIERKSGTAMDVARAFVLFRLGRVDDVLTLMESRNLRKAAAGRPVLALIRDLCSLLVGDTREYAGVKARMQERIADPRLLKRFSTFADVAVQLGYMGDEGTGTGAENGKEK